MIEIVFIGANEEATAEVWQAEARLAQRLLVGQLPPMAQVVSLPAGANDPAAAIRQAWQALDLHGQAWALYLPHQEIVFAPRALERLVARATTWDRVTAAASNLHPLPGLQPNYLTLRGLERWAQGLQAETAVLPWQGDVCVGRIQDLASLNLGKGVLYTGEAYYHDFSGYRAHRREEMLDLLPSPCPSLLDVGGGAGGFLAAVRQRLPHCRTALVELSPAACDLAQGLAERIWQGDFTTVEFDERFACITFLDVLEHSIEPRRMLEKARELLAADGCVVASIPNVGHWSVVADLLEGRWDYAPAGILCITHLRFFTRAGIEALFAEAGYTIERWARAWLPPPAWFNVEPLRSNLAIDEVSLGTVAWHCRARPF